MRDRKSAYKIHYEVHAHKFILNQSDLWEGALLQGADPIGTRLESIAVPANVKKCVIKYDQVERNIFQKRRQAMKSRIEIKTPVSGIFLIGLQKSPGRGPKRKVVDRKYN